MIIDGRQVPFRSTGAFLLRYKMQFRRDPLVDIYKLKDCIKQIVDEEGNLVNQLVSLDIFDSEIFFNLVWTLAKTADQNIPPPMEWLDGFGEFPLYDIMPELHEMILSAIASQVESKKK